MPRIAVSSSLFVLVFVAAGAQAQVAIWEKVVDQTEILGTWNHSYVQTGYLPFENAHKAFTSHFKCWGDSGSGGVKTAPFTTPFSLLYDWTGASWFTTQANSDGVAIWTITWKDSIDYGWNGVERWHHNSTGTEQERRLASKFPTQGN